MDTDEQTFTLDALCTLTGLTRRTVRYYIQIGLVPGPEGETRAARYRPHHLATLLAIRRWTDTGLSLDRVRALLAGADAPAPPRRYGEVEVWSHVALADGVELSVHPERAGLTPEQVRRFLADVIAAFEKLQIRDAQ